MGGGFLFATLHILECPRFPEVLPDWLHTLLSRLMIVVSVYYIRICRYPVVKVSNAVGDLDTGVIGCKCRQDLIKHHLLIRFGPFFTPVQLSNGLQFCNFTVFIPAS